jgi:hypothetical protein
MLPRGTRQSRFTYGVGLAVGGDGSGTWAVGGESSNGLSGPDGGARATSSSGAGGVPAASLDGGDESEDGGENLNRLHYCG